MTKREAWVKGLEAGQRIVANVGVTSTANILRRVRAAAGRFSLSMTGSVGPARLSVLSDAFLMGAMRGVAMAIRRKEEGD